MIPNAMGPSGIIWSVIQLALCALIAYFSLSTLVTFILSKNNSSFQLDPRCFWLQSLLIPKTCWNLLRKKIQELRQCFFLPYLLECCSRHLGFGNPRSFSFLLIFPRFLNSSPRFSKLTVSQSTNTGISSLLYLSLENYYLTFF